MNHFIEEYPKAISRFIIGIAVTYLTGKIPAELMSPEVVSAAQVIVATLTVYLVGRYTRFAKSNIPVEVKSEPEP